MLLTDEEWGHNNAEEASSVHDDERREREKGKNRRTAQLYNHPEFCDQKPK